MSDACYCDYEPWSWGPESSTRTARKEHKCGECGKPILAGERYEYVVAGFEGEMCQHKTCPRCLAVREWVQAHVPCFCWYQKSMLEDALETMREYAHVVPGMGMEFGRLYVRATRRIVGKSRNTSLSD